MFSKTSQQLLRGCGCPVCTKEKMQEANQKVFIDKAKQRHLSRYLYDKVQYTTNRNLVVITCPLHGDFEQTPSNHLKGHGCKRCQYQNFAEKRSNTLEHFIEKAKSVHGDTYDYSLVDYVNAYTKVKIILPGGDVAEQLPSHHLRGFKPSLEPRGLDYQGQGILYYLRVMYKDQVLYKIGITSKSVDERFALVDLRKIEVMHTTHFDRVKDAFYIEQKTLKKYNEFAYKGPAVLESGNTELFIKDIFEGNYSEISTVGEQKAS